MERTVQQEHRRRWLWAGLTGSVVAALCCFTPILVLLVGAVGLGALSGYLDYVLLPALIVFLAMLMYGLSGPRHAGVDACCGVHSDSPSASKRTTQDANG